MALHVQIGLSMQHINTILVDTGCLFHMQALVSAVNALLVGGQFGLARNEIIPQGGRVIYIAASAQDRLRDALNTARPDLMSQVSDWINHLYYCELLYLNRPAVAGGQRTEADGWAAHSYRNQLTQSIMHVPAPGIGLQVSVVVDTGRGRNADLRAELLTSNIRSSASNTTRQALLTRRLRLMAYNASLLGRQ